MKCPKCNAEMEFGNIYGKKDAGVIWIQGEAMKYTPLIIPTKKKYQEGKMVQLADSVLDTGKLIENPTLPTYICRKCRIGTFQY